MAPGSHQRRLHFGKRFGTDEVRIRIREGDIMMHNVVRGVLALVLTALATWLANEIANRLFGPEEETA